MTSRIITRRALPVLLAATTILMSSVALAQVRVSTGREGLVNGGAGTNTNAGASVSPNGKVIGIGTNNSVGANAGTSGSATSGTTSTSGSTGGTMGTNVNSTNGTGITGPTTSTNSDGSTTVPGSVIGNTVNGVTTGVTGVTSGVTSGTSATTGGGSMATGVKASGGVSAGAKGK